MRKLTYLAVLEPSNDGGFGVYFPDFPGCISYGKDIEDAQAMAREALELHIYSMEKDGEHLPAASQNFEDAEDLKGCIVVSVSVYPDLVKNELDNKRVKTNVTLPSWLKKAAESEGVNYSRILETALLDYLGLQEKSQAL